MVSSMKIIQRSMIVLFVILCVVTSTNQASGDRLFDKAMGKVEV